MALYEYKMLSEEDQICIYALPHYSLPGRFPNDLECFLYSNLIGKQKN